ncbi:glutathione S-transferase [Halyomorpha halys]|uniref:glutathione S-transferase n=1 Tax=Halyomorpha halys TaxID=286706 RepID=UPI0006D4EE4B|nr:glutathione S-transferase-like [Halyomorpha halys]XP_024215716.1 glutathione S-transferase-like [Halyomorpha halys]
MTVYKLTYLDAKGLGESIRFILSYLKKEFEDIRLPFDTLSQLRNMPEVPYGRVPYLEIDGSIMYQTTAILRHLSIEAGLNGKNSKENLNIDMIAGTVGDLITEIQRYIKAKESSEKEYIKECLVKEIIPFYMEKFEAIIANEGYLANGKLSWADLYAVGYSESIPGLVGIDLTEKYPSFQALLKKIHSLPGVKDWIQKRPVANI